jgi:hypothetical protein
MVLALKHCSREGTMCRTKSQKASDGSCRRLQ